MACEKVVLHRTVKSIQILDIVGNLEFLTRTCPGNIISIVILRIGHLYTRPWVT